MSPHLQESVDIAVSKYSLKCVLHFAEVAIIGCGLDLTSVVLFADLVIIGCGLHSQFVPPSLRNYFKQHDIAFEAIDTVRSCSLAQLCFCDKQCIVETLYWRRQMLCQLLTYSTRKDGR